MIKISEILIAFVLILTLSLVFIVGCEEEEEFPKFGSKSCFTNSARIDLFYSMTQSGKVVDIDVQRVELHQNDETKICIGFINKNKENQIFSIRQNKITCKKLITCHNWVCDWDTISIEFEKKEFNCEGISIEFEKKEFDYEDGRIIERTISFDPSRIIIKPTQMEYIKGVKRQGYFHLKSETVAIYVKTQPNTELTSYKFDIPVTYDNITEHLEFSVDVCEHSEW